MELEELINVIQLQQEEIVSLRLELRVKEMHIKTLEGSSSPSKPKIVRSMSRLSLKKVRSYNYNNDMTLKVTSLISIEYKKKRQPVSKSESFF